MESRKQWFTTLKNELSKSPLVSNVAFGFILMGLEKLVELEFECPCKPVSNELFSSLFFLIPAIMVFPLMLIIQGCRFKEELKKTISPSSFVPSMVWLTLLFLDGQYFACARTSWEGRYVIIDKAAPQKWCEPISNGNMTLQEQMLESQKEYFTSQCIGLVSFFITTVTLIIAEHHQRKTDIKAENPTELTTLRTSSLPGHHERENTDPLNSPADMDK